MKQEDNKQVQKEKEDLCGNASVFLAFCFSVALTGVTKRKEPSAEMCEGSSISVVSSVNTEDRSESRKATEQSQTFS